MEHLKEEFLRLKRNVGERFKNAVLNDDSPIKKMGISNAPNIREMKEFSKKHRLSELLPYESYDPQTRLYYNKDTVGFMLIANPATKLSVQDISILNEIFAQNHRPNTCIQISMISDPNIDDLLDQWGDHKKTPKDAQNLEMFQLLVEKRKDYLLKGRFESIFKDEKQLVRDLNLIISYTIPLHLEGVSKEGIDFLDRSRNSVEGILRSVGIYSTNVTPNIFLNVLNGLLNPSRIERQPILVHDEQNLISDQIIDRDTMYLFGPGTTSIVHGDEAFTMIPIHVRQFPQNWRAYLNGELVGAFIENERRLTCPFIMTMTVHVPDQVSAKGLVKRKFTRATQMADSPLSKFAVQWKERKEDWSFVSKRVEAGDKLLQAFFQIILIAPSGKEDEAQQTVKNLFKQNQWLVSNSRYIPLHSLLGALPMGITQDMHNELKMFGHYSSRLSWNCTNCAPWIGEWKGTKTPMMLFLGRRGQIAYFNPFDNKAGNYNIACCATSGSGKSFLTQEWVFSALGSGGRAFVIDSGHSYKNLCECLNGTYIDFGSFTPKLNIFSKIFSKANLKKVEELSKFDATYSIKDYTDDFMPMLIDIVSQMASPDADLSEVQKSYLEKAITRAIDKHFEKTTITKVSQELIELSSDPDLGIEAKKLSHMLYSYTEEGMFGKYFEGENNVNLDNDFVVLEMDSLKSKGKLRVIVLQILIMQINQVMYLSGNKEQIKQVIIDEAWQLLGEGRSGSFIEEGYRVARKHGGSYMTITQKISDYYSSKIATAAYMNSDFVIFLRQKSEELASAEAKKQIDNSDGKIGILKTLKMVTGKYSELAIISPDGLSVLRFCVDPITQKIYSTKPDEVAYIRNAQKNGISLLNAINDLIKVQNEKQQ